MTASEHTALSCGTCEEIFARAAFGGRALFLAETLHDAALSAGWQQDGETWTCTVCQIKADTPAPEPDAEPVQAHEPPQDTDPYRQYADMSAELDAAVKAFWAHENQEHNAARFRIGTRLQDAQLRIDELSGVAA